ncbi:hypothetical protein ABLE68_07570 [Nocardioides sp. CN2-186]|uniref:hypothetical protein n=1 Tax=Nocardioides tweenelious TaxID=3156607 RepID=UPI0032B54332
MSAWGVYGVQGRLPDGTHAGAGDRRAKAWFVRWRVDGRERRRTFRQKGYAKTFHDELTKAKLLAWEADDRGWPIDPARAVRPGTQPVIISSTFETYVNRTWWPTVESTFDDKNRLGHRRNARLAVELLRYAADDPRLCDKHPGDSIALADLVADDLRLALVRRRTINGRTAAVNNRRIAAAITTDTDVAEVELDPEVASTATVRAFHITVGMIVKAAMASGHVTGTPLEGLASLAPKPKPGRVSTRLVPTMDEVFDLADAISQLGPLMNDGRPSGERFRSLILVAGTLGPRPGEMVAHRPEWLIWDEPSRALFRKTEAAVYDTQTGLRGRRIRNLKHREDDEYREVPMVPEIATALRDHLERGYAATDRTWTSPTGRGHLDWGNLTTTYWRPALERVFAGTAKAELLTASPKILRKAAITWWLAGGISQTLAAEWAGHSEEVSQLYYASRTSSTYHHEVTLLSDMLDRPGNSNCRGSA